jgi:hypothetical protein
MKRTITLSIAFSVLTATGAFASPQSATSVTQHVVAQASTQVADRKTFDRTRLQLDSKTLVAENRKEFGSQYQRY